MAGVPSDESRMRSSGRLALVGITLGATATQSAISAGDCRQVRFAGGRFRYCSAASSDEPEWLAMAQREQRPERMRCRTCGKIRKPPDAQFCGSPGMIVGEDTRTFVRVKGVTGAENAVDPVERRPDIPARLAHRDPEGNGRAAGPKLLQQRGEGSRCGTTDAQAARRVDGIEAAVRRRLLRSLAPLATSAPEGCTLGLATCARLPGR
jgi:hypothetical protein